ncbi:hypothetical protein CTRI78_v010160 [Colletotrichum trifolii]|uniref:GED domain-containing protein n=1 Tax=Colletotrichum trifolii TaxID=5466 RepID=A0A4R8QNV2_COLTR|nr:hypothetical protein CTRI78_v010160 [Colletotrichum trifolii]
MDPDSDHVPWWEGLKGPPAIFHRPEDTTNLQALFKGANNYSCQCFSRATTINKTLYVRLNQPNFIQLTIMDYPNLAPSVDPEVSVPDPKEDPLGNSLFQEMYEKDNLIICIVSAAKGPVSKRPFQLAQLADPRGRRTIGVVAAPFPSLCTSDVQHCLTETELASLKDRWCLVRYPTAWSHTLGPAGDDVSCIADNLDDSAFPSASSLVPLVTSLFEAHLTSCLPNFVEKLQAALKDGENRFERLTCREKTMEESRRFIFTTWRRLCTRLASPRPGAHWIRWSDDPAFLKENNIGACAAIQKGGVGVDAKLERDAPRQKEAGHYHIYGKDRLSKDISRSVFIDHVRTSIEEGRGQILPGLIDPHLVFELFVEKSEPWKTIVSEGRMEIHNSILGEFNAAFEDSTHKLFSGSLEYAFKAQLMSILDEFRNKMQEVVRSYKVAQPIPYHSSLVKKVQQARKDRQTSALTRTLLNDVIRVDYANIPSSFRQPTMTVESLVQCLVSCLNEDGSPHLMYETLTDYVEEYYNFALQGLLESIRVQAVGGCLIQKLTDVFDPNNTDWITDDIISQVKFESEYTQAEKRLLGRKIRVLGKGVKIIDEYLAPTPADSSGQSSSSGEPVETPDETPVETPDETPVETPDEPHVVDLWTVITDN